VAAAAGGAASIAAVVRVRALASAVLAGCLAMAAPVGHAASQPRAANGHPVTAVARRIPTPTAFAFAYGRIFVAGYGNEDRPAVRGGVFVVSGGKAVELPGSPAHAFGLAFRSGTLYVSAGPRILAWSGWNGHTFTKTRVVVTGPPGFYGFGGLALDRNGTIYAGVANAEFIDPSADYEAGTTPFANDVVTVNPASGVIHVVATGIRQPWQLVFAPGHAGPLVSDLAQDNLGTRAPNDWVVEAVPGADFGFPSCPATPATCSRYAKPFLQFPPHSSPMGLAYRSGRLYVDLYNGAGSAGPEIVSLPVRGGRAVPVVTGFPVSVIALGTANGRLFIGDHDGTIWSVRL